MKPPIKIRRKFRYLLIRSKIISFEDIIKAFKYLYGFFSYIDSNIKLVKKIDEFIIIKVNKKYYHHLLISLSLLKFLNEVSFNDIKVVSISGTLKSLHKKIGLKRKNDA